MFRLWKDVFSPLRFHRGSGINSQKEQTSFLHYQGTTTALTEMLFLTMLFSVPSEPFSIR